VELNDKSPWIREYRDITVRTTDGSTFSGKMNLGHHKRTSDLFKDPSEQFVVLTNVILHDSPGKLVIINKNHIVWVEPGD
jgi:hypothetical protein